MAEPLLIIVCIIGVSAGVGALLAGLICYWRRN